MSTAAPNPERPRYRPWLSLRTLLVLVALLAVGLAYQRHRQTELPPPVVRELRAVGFEVVYWDKDRKKGILTDIWRNQDVVGLEIRMGNDLAPLRKYAKELTSLRSLDVEVPAAQSVDLKPLQDMRALEQLGLRNVTNLSSLGKLPNLQELELHSPQVSDLAPLSKLPNLQELEVASARVSDLTPLTKLKNLRSLLLYTPRASDLTPLAQLTNLDTLFIGGSLATDLSPLAKLTKLRIARLSGRSITDLSPLSDLTGLKSLSVERTQVKTKDIAKLKKALPSCEINSR